MTPSETQLFTLLDNYSRSRCNSFLTEMFLNGAETHYVLCFRPLGGDRNSPNAYAFKYIKLEIAGLGVTAQTQELSSSTRAELDIQLQALRKIT
jgi:hypothetical protein